MREDKRERAQFYVCMYVCIYSHNGNEECECIEQMRTVHSVKLLEMATHAIWMQNATGAGE